MGVTTESKPAAYSWQKTETSEVQKPVETKPTYSWNKTDTEVNKFTESRPTYSRNKGQDETNNVSSSGHKSIETEQKSPHYTWKKTETSDTASSLRANISTSKETLMKPEHSPTEVVSFPKWKKPSATEKDEEVKSEDSQKGIPKNKTTEPEKKEETMAIETPSAVPKWKKPIAKQDEESKIEETPKWKKAET